jgi:serine phosphatase RsbU (regulator of sigma subunit)
MLNFGALAIGYLYGFLVFIRMRRLGYHRVMKYVTSCLDVALVLAVLFLYTTIEIPSVGVKNYVFLIVFPMIALTAFRYDRMLTVVAGGLAIALYIALVLILYFSGAITFTHGGYERELFTSDVTYVGQLTKVLILAGYVLLLVYLAGYSRRLFVKLVSDELSLQSQKELTEWELTMASQVQARLLPRSLPSVTGLEMFGAVQQGRFVGGDYCDFIKLPNERLFLVSADVSGKGVPAALIMAEVRASTHLLSSMQISLEEFAQRLNTLVHQSTDKKSFVTLYAAEVDASRGRLAYINAGHPPPLLCSGGEVRSLTRGTIPLGVCATLPQLTTHMEEFPVGSLLVSYTDGLLEQTDLQGEQFGEERLREFVRLNSGLSAGPLAQRLLDEIKAFGGGRDLNDDVSVAVVKKVG